MATEEAPKSTLPYPPIHKDKKFVVLSDWCAHLLSCPCHPALSTRRICQGWHNHDTRLQ